MKDFRYTKNGALYNEHSCIQYLVSVTSSIGPILLHLHPTPLTLFPTLLEYVKRNFRHHFVFSIYVIDEGFFFKMKIFFIL